MARATGVAGAVIGLVVLSSLLIFGFMVSLVVIPVILVVALAAIGYVWFKTRSIRRELKAQMQAFRAQMPGPQSGNIPGNPSGWSEQTGGPVIDGDEYIHETSPQKSARTSGRDANNN